MQLHVFGASTPTGFALREQADQDCMTGNDRNTIPLQTGDDPKA